MATQERLLLAISVGGYANILYADGECILQDIGDDARGGDMLDDFVPRSKLAEPPPTSGIWVYECTPTPQEAGSVLYDYTQGTFREPTDEEWVALINQENPWEV